MLSVLVFQLCPDSRSNTSAVSITSLKTHGGPAEPGRAGCVSASWIDAPFS